MSLNAALLLSFVLATTDPSTPSPKSQLVEIRAMIAEVSHSKLADRGFTSRFGDGNGSFAHAICSLLSPTTDMARTVAPSRIADGDALRALLRAMSDQGTARIIFQPTTLGCSGRSGKMTIGGEISVPVVDSQGTVTVARREFGTSLETVPVVLGDGRIRLEIRAEVSQPDDSVGVLGLRTRDVTTSVELNSGETLVVGGLFTACAPSPAKTEADGDTQGLAQTDTTGKGSREEKELVILVTPTLVYPVTDTRPSSSSSPAETRIMPASLETDGEVPHAQAASCCRARPCPSICPAEDVPGLFEDASSEDTSADDDDRAPCKLPTLGALQRIPGCGEECCTAAKTKQGSNSSCCQCPTKQATRASRTADAEADEDDGPGCSEEEFADYVQSMNEAVQARMQWEAAILHARVSAEMARQQAKHTEELMEVQAKHQSELQKAREAVWDVERRAIEAQHREAIKHERELADLRLEQVRKTYEARLASFDIDINWRSRDKAVPASTDVARREGLAPAEFSRPSPSISAAHVAEIDMLRREVCRLHALVEDLLCVTPETPPAPVPQHDPDDSSE